MSAFSGSSSIPVDSIIIPALRGPTGPTGFGGNTGPTGSSVRGNTGPTGPGIINLQYYDYGISFIKSDGSKNYLNFLGPVGVSYINGVPQSAVIAKGMTFGPPAANGYSVLYSFVDSFESLNQQILIPYKASTNIFTEQHDLKIRTMQASGSALEGISSDSSYIYLVGKTFSYRNIGNTGELLYKSGNLIYAIDGSKYDELFERLSVPLSADRYTIHNNKNIGAPGGYDIPSIQNIGGYSGASGFGFFNVNFGTFGLNNNKYQITQAIPNSNVSLDLGTSGSSRLLFGFHQPVFNRGASFNPQNITNQNFGSCCFCERNSTGTILNEISCTDYVSSSYCQLIGGNFSTKSCLNRLSTGDCYAEGACCVNGKCVNTHAEKCIQYKGIFYPGEVCSQSGQVGSPYFTCPSTTSICQPETLKPCCVNGYCFDITQRECLSIPGASVASAFSSCSALPTNFCCASIVGACCTKSGTNYTCSIQKPDLCATLNGIFHGSGSKCEEVQCCGTNFIQTYFNGPTLCNATSVQPCFDIGTKMAGGYLVGVIGMPSPCNPYDSPLVAYGQPMACRVNPRGEVNGAGSLTWNWKGCGGENGATLGSVGAIARTVNIQYFTRTKSSPNIDLTYQNNAVNKCFVKYGVPYIQQTYTNPYSATNTPPTILWGDSIQYEGSIEYSPADGRYAYPVGADFDLNYIMVEKPSDTPLSTPFPSYGNPYKYLASQYYGQNSVHTLWALVMAPEDAYSGNRLSWGMEEGRARIGDYNSEPISTFAVDGLLATRLFDESSKQNPKLWFRSNTSTDLKAYDRFCFYNTTSVSKRSNWNSSVVENLVETNINIFREKYSEMWDANNPENSATKQISIWNQNNYYGYSDWYIPSIVELNYIYNNIEKLNTGILLGGDSPINTETAAKYYWSSTSSCYLRKWNQNDHLDYSSYEIQETPTPLSRNNKFRFTKSDFNNLNDKSAYELSLAVCAGENMLAQNFRYTDPSTPFLNVGENDYNSGLVTSFNRRSDGAYLRPVRRIPIVLGCVNQNIEQFITNSYFTTCSSCPGSCVPQI